MHNSLVALLSGILFVARGQEDYPDTRDSYGDVPRTYGDDTEYTPCRCQLGVINMFYGSTHDLPDGYQVCDGSNGTPDLRDTFVIGAGSSYDYLTSGGSPEISLTADQLPSHKHTISSANIDVSYDGKHYHAAKATIGKAGAHTHDNGKLYTEDAGAHSHKFTAETDKKGHEHKYSLWTTKAPNHNHEVSIVTGEAGEHNHDDDIAITEDGSAHGHDISVKVDAVGDHAHKVNIDDFDICFADHKHGVGDIKVAPHKDTHYHNIQEATVEEAGEHFHSIKDDTSSNGDHTHGFDLETDKQGEHDHLAGDLCTDKQGAHSHDVPETTTNKDGDHDHVFDAYLEETYDTYADNKGFGPALDKVDKSNGYKVTVDKAGAHAHVVPKSTVDANGKHLHDIEGCSAKNGIHWHDVLGEIFSNGDHYHQFSCTAAGAGKHSHDVTGTTDDYTISFSHEISGYTAKAPGYTQTEDGLVGQTKPAGAHTHDAVATTTSPGEHVHVFWGSVLPAGKHTHPISGETLEVPDHKHDVEGTIGGPDDGLHCHTIDGCTEEEGLHNHQVKGCTEENGDHGHLIEEIYIFDAGKHRHGIDGCTEDTGLGKPIEIIPPYLAVYYVCCTGNERVYAETGGEPYAPEAPSGYERSYRPETTPAY